MKASVIIPRFQTSDLAGAVAICELMVSILSAFPRATRGGARLGIDGWDALIGIKAVSRALIQAEEKPIALVLHTTAAAAAHPEAPVP